MGAEGEGDGTGSDQDSVRNAHEVSRAMWYARFVGTYSHKVQFTLAPSCRILLSIVMDSAVGSGKMFSLSLRSVILLDRGRLPLYW